VEEDDEVVACAFQGGMQLQPVCMKHASVDTSRILITK
jgi:hypothetical protein